MLLNKQINYSFIKCSDNRKTGNIPVVYSSKNTCPDSCPLKDQGCYGQQGYLNLHWMRTDNGVGTVDLEQLYYLIKSLRKESLWRYGVMGDLPGLGDNIDAAALKVIVEANKGRKGFAFSHKPVGQFSADAIINARAIEYANKNGFTINLSADDIYEADELADLGIGPVVTVLPTDASAHPTRTAKGRFVTVCPAELRPGKVTCDRCGICANPNRKNIVGFRAHGQMRNRINRRLKVIQNERQMAQGYSE